MANTNSRFGSLNRSLEGMFFTGEDHRHVYRGSGISMMNSDEFRDNAISGGVITVYHLEGPEDGLDGVGLGSPLEAVDYNTKEEVRAPVTGGLTTRLGPAAHFAGGLGDKPNAVLHLDTDKIETEVVGIEYDAAWYDEFPAAAAWVMKGDSAVTYNGRWVGNTDTQEDGTEHFHEVGDLAREKAGYNMFTSEYEALASQAEIGLDGALTNVVSYVGDGVSGSSISSYFSEEPALYGADRSYPLNNRLDSKGFAWGLRKIYDAWVELLQWHEQDYWVVGVESMNEFRKSDSAVPRGEFKAAYNGRRVVTDPGKIPHVLGR